MAERLQLPTPATTQDELNILQLELWLEPARLGLITSCQYPLINYLGMDVEQEPPEEKQNNSERKSFYYPIF